MKFEEALKKAASYCAKSERCVQDVKNYLYKLDVKEEQIIEKIIETLKKEKYLDETRYTSSFIHDKFKFNKWGKIKIRYALRNKNIDDTLINEQLDKDIDNDEYISTLKELLLSKKKKLKNTDTNAVIQKISNFALSKGYEPQIIRDIVESIMK